MDTIYNEKGCFYRALDDEPVFVILARDPCAAETVRWWVTLRQALIGRGEKPLEDHSTLSEALDTAQAMVAWRSEATDPATYAFNPRWKVDYVPPRELVETGEIDRLRTRIVELESALERHNRVSRERPTGGMAVDWSDMDMTAVWQIGNRFRMWPDINPSEGIWYLAENDNWLVKDPKRENWTGGYPITHSLQRDMLIQAYKDHMEAVQHKVETLQALLPDSKPSFQGEALRRAVESGTEGLANRLLVKFLDNFKADATGDVVVKVHRSVLKAALSAAATDPVELRKAHPAIETRTALFEAVDSLEALVGDKVTPKAEAIRAVMQTIANAATRVMPLPFIGVDLAGKVAVGLRQITADYLKTVAATTWPHARKEAMNAYADRINGFAAELEDGHRVGVRLQSKMPRRSALSPIFGEAYEPPEVDPYVALAKSIERDSPAFLLSRIGRLLDVDMSPTGRLVSTWYGHEVRIDSAVTPEQLQHLKDKIGKGERLVDLGAGQQP